METDPSPPSFNIPYSVPPMNIGEGYAAGITQAGKSLASATSGVMDVMNRSRTADDTLTALHQNKVLSDEAYKSVAGKSLGAKEALVGMYAGAWMSQQKAQIDAQIAVQKAVAEQRATHPAQVPLVPQQPASQQPASQQPAQQPAPQQPASLAPLPGAPQVNVPNLTLTSQQPFAERLPLGGGAGISNPMFNAPTQYKQGPPIGKDTIPTYSKFVTVKGKPGVLMPDGVTIRPLTGQ